MNNYKITPESFVSKVIELYRQARKAKVNNSRVKRGRSHNISSHVEDVFAEFLAENLGKYTYLVDQPITVEGQKNPIYPDIVLVEDNKIINFLDLKMDLGWNRNGFINFCNKKETLISDIRNKSCRLKDGITKEIKSFEIDENVKYHIVIISDTNIPKKQMKVNIEGVNSLSNVCVYLLTSNQHPNTYDESKLRDIKINRDQFDKLINSLI
ncbi:hypothetical protein [Caloranaerobacter ferrireducens]|uniref:hypothetical protein n=1 Tax=Caloranaerobacter ferrireducens TaxID=1323370 RepID=UPI00084D9CC7|nr:hypothetical protein [Caloranaerobacter ferrireducens]